MISDVEDDSLETAIDSGKLTLVESIAYYNLYLNKQLDRMVVSSGGESPGSWSTGIVFGILAYDRFMTRFGSELDVPKAIIDQSDESMKERTGLIVQVYPKWPHERIGRLIDFAATRIMMVYKDFISELGFIENSGQSKRMDFDFFMEYVEKNSVDDHAEAIRMDCIDFSTACCHALKVLNHEYFDNAE